MGVSSRRRRRVFCMATAATIALSLVIICLTSRVLGQDDLVDGKNNDNIVTGGGRGTLGGGRARIARLRRLQLRPDASTTGSPLRERTRVRVKAIKVRKQKVNADRRATLTQSNISSSSSSDDKNNGNDESKETGNNNGRFFDVAIWFIGNEPKSFDSK